MIEYLFSVMLVPILPALADPNISHEDALRELRGRLSHVQQQVEIDTSAVESARSPSLAKTSSELPSITGRLFAWSGQSFSDPADELVSTLPVDSLRLTGLIESSGQYVGILNDGEKDHVVGVGSYVMGTHQVVSLGKRQMVLMPLDKQARGVPLELNLMPGETPRGL